MDRRPGQAIKKRGDMIKFEATEDKLNSMILNFLEFFNEVFWRTSKQSTTITQR